MFRPQNADFCLLFSSSSVICFATTIRFLLQYPSLLSFREFDLHFVSIYFSATLNIPLHNHL